MRLQSSEHVGQVKKREDFEKIEAGTYHFDGMFNQFTQDEAIANLEKQYGANPRPSSRWEWERLNPYSNYPSYDLDEYQPLDYSNVYFNEAMEDIKDKMDLANRMALIIQGILDRSKVFYPHAPAKTWEPDNFNALISLVYDASMTLLYGEAPDITEYIRKCNALAGPDSVFYGQRDAWKRREAEKENERNRYKDSYNPKEFYEPWNDPGPVVVSPPQKWMPRAKKAKFDCKRSDFSGKMTHASITCELDTLFNVSAYKPGDFKQFYRAPRTRQEYLKWAPMLLSAEKYYAEKLKQS